MSFIADHLIAVCLLIIGIVVLGVGVGMILLRPAASDFIQTEAIFSNMRIAGVGLTTPFVTFTVDGKTVTQACQPVRDSELNAEIGDKVRISYKCTKALSGTSWFVLWGDGDQTVESAGSSYSVLGRILVVVGCVMLLGGILLMSKGH